MRGMVGKPISVRLDEDTRERLRRRAELEDRPAAKIIRRAILRELGRPIVTRPEMRQ